MASRIRWPHVARGKRSRVDARCGRTLARSVRSCPGSLSELAIRLRRSPRIAPPRAPANPFLRGPRESLLRGSRESFLRGPRESLLRGPREIAPPRSRDSVRERCASLLTLRFSASCASELAPPRSAVLPLCMISLLRTAPLPPPGPCASLFSGVVIRSSLGLALHSSAGRAFLAPRALGFVPPRTLSFAVAGRAFLCSAELELRFPRSLRLLLQGPPVPWSARLGLRSSADLAFAPLRTLRFASPGGACSLLREPCVAPSGPCLRFSTGRTSLLRQPSLRRGPCARSPRTARSSLHWPCASLLRGPLRFAPSRGPCASLLRGPCASLPRGGRALRSFAGRALRSFAGRALRSFADPEFLAARDARPCSASLRCTADLALALRGPRVPRFTGRGTGRPSLLRQPSLHRGPCARSPRPARSSLHGPRHGPPVLAPPAFAAPRTLHSSLHGPCAFAPPRACAFAPPRALRFAPPRALRFAPSRNARSLSADRAVLAPGALRASAGS
jgi:hypothetical protein